MEIDELKESLLELEETIIPELESKNASLL